MIMAQVNGRLGEMYGFGNAYLGTLMSRSHLPPIFPSTLICLAVIEMFASTFGALPNLNFRKPSAMICQLQTTDWFPPLRELIRGVCTDNNL